MNIGMAAQASRAPAEKTLALPETDRIIRKTARPSIRPVSRVAILLLAVFEDRHEEIEIIAACLEFGREHIAQRMALRAHGGASGGVKPGGNDDGFFARVLRVVRAGSMATLAT